LDSKIKQLEDKVHPLLPDRQLPEGQQPKLPKNLWKKAFDYEKPWTQL